MQTSFSRLLKRIQTDSCKKLVAVFILAVSQISSFSQNVGINNDGSSPHSSAMLDIKSTNKGLLIPRLALKGATDMSTVSSPQVSLLVYNTSTAGEGAAAITPGFYFWSGAKWEPLSTA